jgi:hypothetical protein
MNLVQAIIEVNMEGRKVFKAGEHTVESCDKINCCNGSPIVDHSHNIFTKNLPALMQLVFKEIIDWSKVKVDARVIITTNCGRPVKRHFAKYCDSRIVTFDSGVTSWTDVDGNTTSWEPDEVTLAE